MSYDYTYFTCLTNNSDSQHTGSTVEPSLQFNEDRQNPIITNTKQYDVAITNFKLDTKCLPSFIPVIKYNKNTDKTQDTEVRMETIYEVTYSVTIENKLYSATAPCKFIPQDETVSGTMPPQFINGYADYKSGFYNVYNYENFFKSVNEALRLCAFLLRTVLLNYFPDVYYVFPATGIGDFPIPYFIFDKDSSLAYVNAPAKTFDITMPEGITLYLNSPLYRLFDSLPFTKKTLNFNTLNYLTKVRETVTVDLHKINFNNFENTNLISLIPKYVSSDALATEAKKIDHFIIYQDYETLTSWSPVESLVITSNTLPIKPSVVSQNHSYVQGFETTEGSSNIIEMELNDFRGGQLKAGVIYDPTNYRWINMLDMAELKHINFQVFYRLKINGALIPFKLNSGGSFGLKLCFRKLK